jgi:DNA-binding MarR family transcriptional regulator
MMTEKQIRILNHIRDNPGSTQTKIAESLLISRQSLRSALLLLKAKGCINWTPFLKKGGITFIRDTE